jgi:lauroyl/myristoyl acyltransferase
VPFSENFKSGYKDLAGRWFFSALRHGEQQLPRETFYSTLKSFFFLRASVNCAFRKCDYAAPRPEFLRLAHPAQAKRQQRTNDYLNSILNFFPERLAGEKWKGYCRIEGLEHLEAPRREGRSAILVLCHFGPFMLARCLLRSCGIPVAALLGKSTGRRGPLERAQDRLTLFPEVPLRFYGDQLRGADEFLATAGNLLVMPIDGPTGKQMDVPFCEGWTFRMATGAIRLAIRNNADLIPLCIVDEGEWRFSIKMGEPVPREFLSGKEDWVRAGKHLLDEMLPVFRAHPEQCRPDMTHCLRKDNVTALPAESLDECPGHAEERLAR